MLSVAAIVRRHGLGSRTPVTCFCFLLGYGEAKGLDMRVWSKGRGLNGVSTLCLITYDFLTRDRLTGRRQNSAMLRLYSLDLQVLAMTSDPAPNQPLMAWHTRVFS